MGIGASGIALAIGVGGNFRTGLNRDKYATAQTMGLQPIVKTEAVSAERRLDENQAVAILVRRCVAGDAAAWEDIVRQFNRRIYNLCYRFAGSPDDAQDLTQEVFIKI